MGAGKILIVDDDRNLLEVLGVRVESSGYEVTTATREDEALEAARNEAFDLALVDLQLERYSGITLMNDLKLLLPDMPVIILTAFGTIESAVEAMKQGAYGYLTKPFNPRDLFSHIEKALEDSMLTSDINRLKGLLDEEYSSADIVARSEKMQQVLNVVSRIAVSDSTVYIHGESGTGKELIAKAIHLASERREKPFVALNCAALPEPLLESRLFGHEKGAFTGAIQSAKGLFTQAHEGTIFLDEIGDMSLTIQAKVLRVLQERQFYPIGSEKLMEVDVRVIVATNKDLEEEAKKGLFRSDLFYRIHVIPIYLPPLRERKEDIPSLVDHFIKRLSQQMKKEIKGLTPEAMRKLMLHDWQGNVRELENALEYAAAMARSDVITEEFILQPRRSSSEEPFKPLKEARDAFERGYLIKLLQACKGNVSEAAELAGKYRTDFYSLLKKHSLNPAEFR
ncbi:MAG: sigma-54 dependent transcriptional regulator [Syntrophorhabdales bacterium]